MTTCKSVSYGKPDAGNPHVRFDEGEVAPENPRRGSLLYKAKMIMTVAAASAMLGAFGAKTKVASVRHLASGRNFSLYEESGEQVVRFPEDFHRDQYADAFEIALEKR